MARRELVRIDSSSLGGASLRAAVGSFLGYCASKNLSPNTIIYYRCRLEAFCRYLDDIASGVTIDEIDAPVVRGFIAGETVSNGASTANLSVTALRSFFNYPVSDGFLDNCPMSRVQRVRQPR